MDPASVEVELKHLVEDLARGNVLLFLGEEVDEDLPSSRALADRLRTACNYPYDRDDFFQDVALFYEARLERNALIREIREALGAAHSHLPPAYKDVTSLPVRTIVTMSYHDRLDRAHRDYGDANMFVADSDLHFSEANRRNLVWLRGRLDRNIEQLLITTDDYAQKLHTSRIFGETLRGELTQRQWLLLGCSPDEYRLLLHFFEAATSQTHLQAQHHLQRRILAFGSARPRGVDYDRLKKKWVIYYAMPVRQVLSRLHAELRKQQRHSSASVGTPGAGSGNEDASPMLPFPGLDAFNERYAALFFGREYKKEELRETIVSQQLSVLHGLSGAGKTSLLHAGLLPGLRDEGFIIAGERVRVFHEPEPRVRQAIREALQERTPAEDLPFPAFLSAAAAACPRPLLLVLDQFEELFTSPSLTDPEREAFLQALRVLFLGSWPQPKIVFSLRYEWLGDLLDLLARPHPKVAVSLVQLKHLTEREARDAVVKPLESCGYSVEPALLERLIEDLRDRDRNEVLAPQLQIVCKSLFEKTDPFGPGASGERKLTLALYNRLGGAAQLLGTYLHGELAHLTRLREPTRVTLEELVTAYQTKAVKSLEQLAGDTELDEPTLRDVLDWLKSRRLVRDLDQPNGKGAMVYELAHEYLIGALRLDDEVAIQRRWLRQNGLPEWRSGGALIGRARLEQIFLVREELIAALAKLYDADALRELLLRSALDHGFQVAAFAALLPEAQRVRILAEVALGSGEAEDGERSGGAL